MTQPSGLKNMLRAAAGALPFVPRGDQLPERTVTVDESAHRPRKRRRVRRGHRSAFRRRRAADLPVRVDVPVGDVAGDAVSTSPSPQWVRCTSRTRSPSTAPSR